VLRIPPPLGFERDPACTEEALARLLEHNPAFVLVALGCPKQEVFMHTHAGRLTPAVCLGIGASLDFIAATVRRAPRWMSEAGLEWTYRLFQDPARMYQRYLIRDRAIVPIFVRMLRMPHAERAFFVER
jgi:N-acetylglucosaminyldiphosphoundecaprenol N-acetyl-beta-D-mannosaminyltransferase